MRNVVVLLLAISAGMWAALVRAEAPPDAPTAKAAALVAQCKNWRVSAAERRGLAEGKGWRILGGPSEDMCREVAARGLAQREACRAVGEKLAGGAVGVVVCAIWYRREDRRLVGVPDVPEEIWSAHHDGNRLREVLERRLDKDWEQPRVHKELEAVGFTCGMSREIPSLHVLGELSTPAFMCVARVSSTGHPASAPPPALWDHHLYLWVEVRFTEHTEPRRQRQIIVHSDGYALF